MSDGPMEAVGDPPRPIKLNLSYLGPWVKAGLILIKI